MTFEFRIVEATTVEEFEQAAPLMREFVVWLRARYRETPKMIDTYYDAAAWENELRSLQEQYSAPNGALLLAVNADQQAGCVAMRKLDDGICEMKRLYVRAPFHKFGIGRSLCEHLLGCARDRGFHRMRLETGDEQVEAQTLYRSMGFHDIGPYHAHPVELLRRMVFMELVLQ